MIFKVYTLAPPFFLNIFLRLNRKILDLNIDDFQLYDELDEYGISDEDEDFYPINEQNDDTISFASTPRPQIKPYFDTTSFGLISKANHFFVLVDQI